MPMAVVQHMHDHHIMIIFVNIHSLNLLLYHAHHSILLIDCIFSAMQEKVTPGNVYVSYSCFICYNARYCILTYAFTHIHMYMYVYGCVPINNAV